MTPAPNEEDIFHRAIALPAGEREAFVRRECAGNEALRAAVATLLRVHTKAEDFLQAPAPGIAATALVAGRVASEQPGERIGRYKLLQKIGEGGCGTVYMAEQEEPVRRRVALKVIKLGMDTKAVIARFEAERQALALMDHPNIAKVLDAGATENGRPYFVMELVRGIPITKYCDEGNLSTERRLELFTQVCHAIQHAHQKGIIHRDVKPSNILVTMHDGAPVPKVIDFGIAKATQGKLTDATLFTAFEQFIGTPAYMSPEQADMSALDIDTRSDIYSLGVLLYELLTGRPPFDPRTFVAAGLDEMRRIIREVEPPRPSTRLATLADGDRATIARLRGAAPAQLRLQLSGDLDWIVMKALEKNRTRRYESASALAADIQRHLVDEPVIARPPSTAYLLQKLVRRHQVVVAAGAAVAAALVLGLALSTWSFLREKTARERAVAAERTQGELRQQAEAARAEEAKQRTFAEAARTLAETNEKKAVTAATKSAQVAEFLRHMLEGVGPAVALGRDTELLREILDHTAKRVGSELHGQPEVEAELRTILGTVYYDLGKYGEAETMLRAALAAARRSGPDDAANTASALVMLGKTLLIAGKPQESEAVLREAVGRLRQLPAEKRVLLGAALNSLATAIRMAGKVAEALAMHREAIDLLRNSAAIDPILLAEALGEQGATLQLQGALAEAEASCREALALQRSALGPEHPGQASLLSRLAGIAYQQRRYPESAAHAREAQALFRKFFGPEHPMTVSAGSQLSLAERQEAPEANPAAKPSRPAGEAPADPLSPPDAAAAIQHLEQAVALLPQGKLAEARAEFAAALPGLPSDLGVKNPLLPHAPMMSAVIAMQQGAAPEVIEEGCRQALALYRKLYPGSTYVAGALTGLVEALLPQGKLEEAETAAREGVALFDQHSGAGSEYALRLRQNLAQILTTRGRLEEAAVVNRETLRLVREGVEPGSLELASRLINFALPLAKMGRFAEAEPLAREGLALRRKLAPSEVAFVASAEVILSLSLVGQKKYAEAEPLLLAARTVLEPLAPGQSKIDRATLLQEITENLDRISAASRVPAK